MGLTLYLILSWIHDLSVIGFVLLILWAMVLLYKQPLATQSALFRRLFAFFSIIAFGSGTVIAAFSPLELTHPLNVIKIVGSLLATGFALTAFNAPKTLRLRWILAGLSLITLTLLILFSIPSTSIFGF